MTNIQTFVEKAQNVHGNKYDYSRMKFRENSFEFGKNRDYPRGFAFYNPYGLSVYLEALKNITNISDCTTTECVTVRITKLDEKNNETPEWYPESWWICKKYDTETKEFLTPTEYMIGHYGGNLSEEEDGKKEDIDITKIEYKIRCVTALLSQVNKHRFHMELLWGPEPLSHSFVCEIAENPGKKIVKEKGELRLI